MRSRIKGYRMSLTYTNKHNLINKLATVHVKSRLENSTLPRLKSFNLTYNYRILEEIKGKNRSKPNNPGCFEDSEKYSIE